MTIEEQIQQASVAWYNRETTFDDTYHDNAFCMGAEWADEHPIGGYADGVIDGSKDAYKKGYQDAVVKLQDKWNECSEGEFLDYLFGRKAMED